MSKTAKLTPEERRDGAAKRRRIWARANPEKIKAYRLNAIRKAALHDILTGAPEYALFSKPKQHKKSSKNDSEMTAE